jgi:CYTH domain-containing protein
LIAPKYSVIEHERRFLVDRASMPVTDGRGRLIEDRYLIGTMLRLRRITTHDAPPVHKLGKKYPGASLSSRPMTNIYLDATEYAGLAALPAAELVKRRYDAGRGFVLDVFQGALSGLVLAEIEADSAPALAAVEPPNWVLYEITDDPAYAGGTLAISGVIPERGEAA